jgi:hypothetical protein
MPVEMRLPLRPPSVNWDHIDGPVLLRGDGTMYWLSWADRFMLWRGKVTIRELATKASLRSGPWWRRLLCDLGRHAGRIDHDERGMWFRCAYCQHKSGFIPWRTAKAIDSPVSPV